jgi:hypothetical protein
MPATTQAYDFADILEALRLRLVSVLGLDDHYVRSVASDQYKYTTEETLVALRPLGVRPDVNAGGGRRARPCYRTVRCYISKRSSLDFVGSDSVVLETLFDTENQILDALDDFWPMDTSGTVALTIEPVHPTDSSNGPPVRKPDEDTGEVYSMLSFEVRYLQINNTPSP